MKLETESSESNKVIWRTSVLRSRPYRSRVPTHILPQMARSSQSSTRLMKMVTSPSVIIFQLLHLHRQQSSELWNILQLTLLRNHPQLEGDFNWNLNISPSQINLIKLFNFYSNNVWILIDSSIRSLEDAYLRFNYYY